MRQRCLNLMCHVYIFGISPKVCPGCGEEGARLTEKQDADFLVFFRSTESN